MNCETNDREEIIEILKETYGPKFRISDSLVNEIAALVHGQNFLLCEKTGKEKAVLLLAAAKYYKNRQKGPIVIISYKAGALKAQLEPIMERIGLSAIATVADTKKGEEDTRPGEFDQYDLVFCSPSLLKKENYWEAFVNLEIPLVEIDEIEYLSEYSPSFFPEYRRVRQMIQKKGKNCTALFSTMGTNRMVMEDIWRQFKDRRPQILRRSMKLPEVSIQVHPEQSIAKNMAWIARYLQDPANASKQGVIYTRNAEDAALLSDFLSAKDIPCVLYRNSTEMSSNDQYFNDGAIQVLITVYVPNFRILTKNVDFILHFGLPNRLDKYYRQISFAGSPVHEIEAVLLHNEQDFDEIEAFAQKKRVSSAEIQQILQLLSDSEDGLSETQILSHIELSRGTLRSVLRQLVDEKIIETGRQDSEKKRYQAKQYRIGTEPFDAAGWQRKTDAIFALRNESVARYRDFLYGERCKMDVLLEEFFAPDSKEPCGLCSTCHPPEISPDLPESKDQEDVEACLNGTTTIPKMKKGARSFYENGVVLYRSNHGSKAQKILDAQNRNLDQVDDQVIKDAADELAPLIDRQKITMIIPVPSDDPHKQKRMNAFVSGLLAELRSGRYNYRFLEISELKGWKPLELVVGEPDEKTGNAGKKTWRFRETPGVQQNLSLLKGKSILLIDEDIDSGTTFGENAKLLFKAGAEHIFPFALINKEKE